jgi:lipopolysaccharide export system permease protein
MLKIDRYILKKFIVTFLFCMLLFTVIAVAVDSSEKADDFVKANLSTGEIITEYYLGFVPFIWNLLFPLFVFIAVIFFTSRMASRSEIIAILASGTSYKRFLLPYFIGGLMLGSLLWVGSRYWIPKANSIRSDFQSKYVDSHDPTKQKREVPCMNCFYRRTDSNTFIGLRNYDTSSRTARPFFMEKVKDNKVIYNLRAETLKWDTAVNKWKLFNAAERVIDSMGERLTQRAEMHISISLHPDELRRDDYLKDKLTTPELTKFIKSFKSGRTQTFRNTSICFITYADRCCDSQPAKPGRKWCSSCNGNRYCRDVYYVRSFLHRICDKRKFSSNISRLVTEYCICRRGVLVIS